MLFILTILFQSPIADHEASVEIEHNVDENIDEIDPIVEPEIIAEVLVNPSPIVETTPELSFSVS